MTAAPEPGEDMRQAVNDVFESLNQRRQGLPPLAAPGSPNHIDDHNTMVEALLNLDDRCRKLQGRLKETQVALIVITLMIVAYLAATAFHL